MRLDHPVFQGPLKVDLPLEEDEEAAAKGYTGKTWLVHTGKVPDEVDVGVVSDGHGFEDSPDCERISGGVNSKGPRALAIGRQGNMLQWGFYGAPDRMTESARRVFLNALVYMTRFDGHAPLVEKTSRGRSWLRQHADAILELSGSEKDQARILKYHSEKFPPEVAAAAKDDPEAAHRWYEANQEYIAGERWDLKVDEDVRSLGVSNRKPEFLDTLLARLEKDPQDALALRLSARYVGSPHGDDAASLRAWVTKSRPWLFFTDTGGYRWMVDTNARQAAAAAREPPGGSR